MISIVIPALNEADAIGGCINDLRQTLDNAGISGYEIVVVNDGSTDETSAVARGLGARVIDNLHNLGYGHSLKRGINAAAFDTIVITDADQTYPVQEIPAMLEVYKRGFDLVIGSRSNVSDHDRPIKRLMRRIFRRIVEIVAGRTVPDVNSGLRIFSRKAVLGYFPMLCDTFSFTTSQTLALMLDGHFVFFYPLTYQAREGISKVRLLRDSFRTMQYVVQTVLYTQPLRIFILFSSLLVAMSLIAFLTSFITRLNLLYFLGIGGILAALLVFCLGMLADLLRQIMIQQRRWTTETDRKRDGSHGSGQ
jgi:glycosyltransferase involved in cell wall biosynthesis